MGNSNSQNGAMSGMAAGAAAGSVLPGVGTAIGAGVGYLAGGYIGGMFDGEDKPWYDENWFAARKAQIGTFEQNLAAARGRYLTSLGNMYNQAYSRFSGNAEAGFAARGLQVNGGAFASALANKTADYQAQLEPLAFQAEREDLGNVQNMYAGLFNSQTAAKMGQSNLGFQTGVENDRAMGGFGTSLLFAGMNNKAAANPSQTRGYNNYNGGPGGFDPGWQGPSARTGTVRNGQVIWD